MKSPHRIFLASLMGATLFAAAAHAEKVFPVNDNNTGLFDQPSVAMNGSVAHVAFIGDNTGTGYRVYHAAVNGAADFTNVLLQRDNTVILAPAATVDNTDIGNDLYADARHPKIALRSATELVILFQAKPTSTSDTAYRLYIARLTLAGNAVVGKSVKQVQGLAAGNIEDVSWALVPADNTARIVYSNRAAIAPTEPFALSFARVGLDNAAAAPPVAITSAYPSSQGYRPVPNMKLDDLNRAHIAWAANDASGSNPGPVYYAMIDQTNGVDNMLIAPTAIMTRYFMRYSFPSVLVFGRSLITVIAADEIRGDMGYVQVNPDEARKNGLPAWDNLSSNNRFLPVPPGEVILPAEFRLFRPEAFYEPSSGRTFVTGYGTAGCAFLAMKINAPAASADLVTAATPFAFEELPSGIDNDYTQAAFGFPGSKVLVFWSGQVPGSGNRNLDVTTVATVAAWVSSSESGCAMVPDPARGAAGSIPGTLLLFLPAAVLAARRLIVKRGRRPAPRGTMPGARRPAGGTIGR